MGTLPNSFREHNRTSKQFRKQYAKLPKRIKELVRVSCCTFNQDPNHPSLRRHPLLDNKQGSHAPDSFSVSITMQYRAIYFVDEPTGQNVWYWIGTHADYDQFTGP